MKKRFVTVVFCTIIIYALCFALVLPTIAAVNPWSFVNKLYDLEDIKDFDGAYTQLEGIMENASFFTDPNVVIATKAKMKHYKSNISLYTQTHNAQSFNNATNEHDIGVKIGTCDNVDNLKYSDSLLFTYTLNEYYFAKARESGRDLYYAFNIEGEGTETRKLNFAPKAEELATLCNKYSDLKVFVRFGAEFNIWQDRCTPDEFIAAFRQVAGILKSKCSNVAMIWGINYGSHADLDYMEYYPGDEYVDWIGSCFYAEKYFKGITFSGAQEFLNNVYYTQYFRGNAADPVIVLKELNDNFAGRKPIMITECGTLAKVNEGNRAGEDTTDFALSALRKIYEYVPMCFPQIKAIAHFNTYLPGRSNDFALKNAPALEAEYNRLIQAPHFIDPKGERDAISYVEIKDGFKITQADLPLSCYVKSFTCYEPQVEYYLDGKSIGSSNTIPYRINFDCSSVANGIHSLKISAKSNGAEFFSKTFQLNVAIPRVGDKINSVLSTDIVAYIEDKPIKSFNIDGYTAVIAEELADYGFNVKWVGGERTLYITAGSRKSTANYIAESSKEKIGTPIMDVLFTDITTRCNGTIIPGFNVGGKTIVYIDNLAAYGNLKWDPEERTIRFTFS